MGGVLDGVSFALAEIIVVVAFMCAGAAVFMPSRTWMMRIRLISTSSYSVYFFLKEAYSGCFGSMIAFLGTVTQVVVPEKYLDRTLKLRAGIAVALAICGMVVFWGAESMLPLLAMIIARMSEIQSCQQRIRIGFLCAQSVWLAFAFESGLMPFIMTETILLGVTICAIAKHEIETRFARRNSVVAA